MTAGSDLLRRRWPALALIASLVLNGFLIGLVATDFFRPHRGGLSGERFARFELRRFDDRLPTPAVDKIAAALVPLAPALDQEIGKLRGIRAEIMRLAAQPNPDRVAIDAKLAELRTQSAAMQEVAQKATYDALLSLPPDQRARLGDERRD